MNLTDDDSSTPTFTAKQGRTANCLTRHALACNIMGAQRYRQHLCDVVASSTAPYGYTLTLWTAGAVTTHAQGSTPSTADALLLLAGAVIGYGAVASLAYGGINGVLTGSSAATVRIWGGMHLPSVGVSIALAALLAHLLHGHYAWPAVGFTATAAYLLIIGAQFWLSARPPTRQPPDRPSKPQA